MFPSVNLKDGIPGLSNPKDAETIPISNTIPTTNKKDLVLILISCFFILFNNELQFK